MSAVKRASLLLAVLGAAGVLGTACTGPGPGRTMAPVCSPKSFNPLMLVAQSVPTAERIPCIVSYPAGWSLGRVEVRSGRTSFTLRSDRAGSDALKVTLAPTCDTAGAVEVRTDELGTARHDRRVPTRHGVREERIYGFSGGCVTYRFGFSLEQTLTDEASMAVGFRTRAQVDADAREQTRGQVHL